MNGTAISPHANHTRTEAGELLDSDGSHCVQCACSQCVEPTRTLVTDDGAGTYECGPDACGYTGEFYCQECGHSEAAR